jgi:hypothetical protein
VELRTELIQDCAGGENGCGSGAGTGSQQVSSTQTGGWARQLCEGLQVQATGMEMRGADEGPARMKKGLRL